MKVFFLASVACILTFPAQSNAGACGDYLRQVVETRGLRLFVRQPLPIEKSWPNRGLQKMGARVMPTILSTTLLITVPASVAFDAYIDMQDDNALRAIDTLISDDLRFDAVLNAKLGGLSERQARAVALAIKQSWETYANEILRSPIDSPMLDRHFKMAENWIVPFQDIASLFDKPPRELSYEDKRAIVEISDQYNLLLLLLGEYYLSFPDPWRVDPPAHLANAVQILKEDPFVQKLLLLSLHSPGQRHRIYRALQTDIENRRNLAIAARLKIQLASQGRPITLEDLRAELLNDYGFDRTR